MKDARYEGIKALLELNKIQRFQDIFFHIAKRRVYEDLGMGFAAFAARCKNPGLFSIDDIRKLANLIDIDPRVVLEVILKEKEKPRKK